MTISTEQLQQLVEALNARLGEFGGASSNIAKFSLGHARIAWEVVQEVTAKEEETDDAGEEGEDQYGAGFRLGFEEGARQSVDGKIGIWGNGRLAYMPSVGAAISFAGTPELNGSTVPGQDEIERIVATVGKGEPHYEQKPGEEEEEGEYIPSLDDDEDFGDEPIGIAGPPAPTTAHEYCESFSEAPAVAPLSDYAAAMLGPEHVQVTPLKPIGRDRLPAPDVARAKIADALANGSGGALVQALNRPRTLAEVDGVDDDEEEDEDHKGKPAREMTPARRRQLDRLSLERRMARERQQALGKRGYVLPTLKEVITELQRQAMGGNMPSVSQFDGAKPANWAGGSAQSQRLGYTWSKLGEMAGLKPNPVGSLPKGQRVTA